MKTTSPEDDIQALAVKAAQWRARAAHWITVGDKQRAFRAALHLERAERERMHALKARGKRH